MIIVYFHFVFHLTYFSFPLLFLIFLLSYNQFDFFLFKTFFFCDPVRGPVRDPVRGPVRDPIRGSVRGPVRGPVLVLSTPLITVDRHLHCRNVELSTGPHRCNVQRWRGLNERKICVFNIINISIR